MFDVTKLKFPSSYVVFDFETTGLDIRTAEVVEIGAKRHAKDGSVDAKSWLMNLGHDVPEITTKITGITTEEMMKDGVPPETAWAEFLEFVGKYPSVGHNIIRYDIPILERYRKAPTDFNMLIKYPVDTAALYKAYKMKDAPLWYENHRQFAERVLDTRAPGLKFRLELACQEMEIDVSDLEAHRAASDVEMSDRLFRHMMVIGL